jgi:hypothetical protein
MQVLGAAQEGNTFSSKVTLLGTLALSGTLKALCILSSRRVTRWRCLPPGRLCHILRREISAFPESRLTKS